MNAKRAKALRRAAEAATVGRPARARVRNHGGVVVQHPESTRGVYRRMKAAAP